MAERFPNNGDPVVELQPTAEPEPKDVSEQNQSLWNIIVRGMSNVIGYVRPTPPLETHPSARHDHHRRTPLQESRQQKDSEESLNDTLKTLNEVRGNNGSLIARISKMEKDSKSKLLEKENEITDLLVQLDQISEEEKDQNYKAEIYQKDSLIAELQKRIEKLCEGKEDTSCMLAKSLGERDRELEKKNGNLTLERSRLRAYKNEIAGFKGQLKEAKIFEVLFIDRSNECTKLELEVDQLATEVKELKLDRNIPRVVKTDSFEVLLFDGLKVKATESTDLENQLASCQQIITEKEQQLINLETQLEAAQNAAKDVVKIKDHSKLQSRVIMQVKQELDATKMAHDELVEYKVSLEHQVEDTEIYSRGLEKDIQKLREELESMYRDRDVWEQSMIDTRNAFGEQLNILRLQSPNFANEPEHVCTCIHDQIGQINAHYTASQLELADCRKQLETAIADNSTLSDEVLARTQQVRHYKKQTDSYKATLDETADKLENAQRELQDYKDCIQRMEEDHQQDTRVNPHLPIDLGPLAKSSDKLAGGKQMSTSTSQEPRSRLAGQGRDPNTPVTSGKEGSEDESKILESKFEADKLGTECVRKVSVLEEDLDDEIRQINEDFTTDRDKQMTDEHFPLDHNFTCHHCSKVVRTNQPQKFKVHEKECELAEGMSKDTKPNHPSPGITERLSGDTQPFSISSPPNPPSPVSSEATPIEFTAHLNEDSRRGNSDHNHPATVIPIPQPNPNMLPRRRTPSPTTYIIVCSSPVMY